MGDIGVPSNGAAVREMWAPPPNPRLSSIGSESWARAEKLTQDIIFNVQPTIVSEKRRKSLIDYVQRLFRGSLHCEVFSYGSVPLKTFLPDGDIDLTAFGGSVADDGLAASMVSILEEENRNKDAEFSIEDVQLICAEVKLVKCIIQNIIVDISFNQIGGLCSLCFLEKVDQFIGKDHLFKRSIILIKAWCYYESRILGAHHGLISTYALEILILYIFHLFHATLDGPLAVLYKFLDYFSNFEWDKYCISLAGPVRLSSLPEIVVEMPQNSSGDFLLSNDFIRECIGEFSVPSNVGEMSSRSFQQKHLNIVDPLKENNNLGRSVGKGNFYRICSAFTYGASKLGRVLQSKDNIAGELTNFFSNTLSRHRTSTKRSDDVEDLSPSAKDCKVDGFARLSGDSIESACSIKQSLTLCNDSDDGSPVLGSLCKPFFAPHLFFTKSTCNKHEGKKGSEKDDHSDDKDRILNGLCDLSGDYEHHVSCLQYGQQCYEQPGLPLAPPSLFQVKHLSDSVQQPSQSIKYGFSQRICGGAFIPTPLSYTMNHQPSLSVPSFAFGFEEMPKLHGTGTYLPNVNRLPRCYRHSKGRSEASLSYTIKNEKKTTLEEMPQSYPAVDRRVVFNQSF
ncbi:unnamed protein product [Cuscuta epithymum]|uniref:Polymerase nucleotidyl transferase domain-containing protein n=1 Tax=Cuscuta epithymum TaxID=186058 RepID=A0AAV0CBP4_9ASTE|nr:unnamed protein product [Cuscuta epithymum]